MAAPLDSASIPTAPEPAHKSRNLTSSIRGAITLKRVSRRRSEVGRTSSEGGLFRFRPLYLPAITRMILNEASCGSLSQRWLVRSADHSLLVLSSQQLRPTLQLCQCRTRLLCAHFPVSVDREPD